MCFFFWKTVWERVSFSALHLRCNSRQLVIPVYTPTTSTHYQKDIAAPNCYSFFVFLQHPQLATLFYNPTPGRLSLEAWPTVYFVQLLGPSTYSVLLHVQQIPGVVTRADVSFPLTCNFSVSATQVVRSGIASAGRWVPSPLGHRWASVPLIFLPASLSSLQRFFSLREVFLPDVVVESRLHWLLWKGARTHTQKYTKTKC